MLVAAIVPGFAIDGFWWALLFGIVLALVNTVLDSFARDESAKE
jgi:putative membrane protein